MEESQEEVSRLHCVREDDRDTQDLPRDSTAGKLPNSNYSGDIGRDYP